MNLNVYGHDIFHPRHSERLMCQNKEQPTKNVTHYLKSLELISLKLTISRDLYPTHKNIDPGATRTRITHESAFNIDRSQLMNAIFREIHVPKKETTHTIKIITHTFSNNNLSH
jgi:hypothetical protein